jgi:hypothetical protein
MREHNQQRLRTQPARPRRGAALAIAILFVFAIGAVATTSVMLSANSTLLARSVDHDRELRYATEAALNYGKSRLNAEPAILPDTGMLTLLDDTTLNDAQGHPITDVKVSVWLAQTGSTSGQYGHFASVLARAQNAYGTGASYVRRLELTQESFAKFAYWTNSETSNGQTIYFGNGDQLWGPVFSNDVIHIDNSGATFNDGVATAATSISGSRYGNFKKGYLLRQPRITLPTNAALAKLSGYAAEGDMDFTSTVASVSRVLTRIEFTPVDLDGNGDSTGVNEGFFRVYKANSGNQAWLRADWPSYGYNADPTTVLNCGDWHAVPGSSDLKFFPAAVHQTTWFKALMIDAGMSSSAANSEQDASFSTIMKHSGARCYLGGDPHLVAVERTSTAYPADSIRQKGGDDTTFTATDPYGAWGQYSASPNASVSAARPDAPYLFPIYRGLNTGSKGVIYVKGTVGISGVLRGRVTLYADSGSVVVLDNTRYTADPSKGVCLDMLGIIAANDIAVADNSLLDPQLVRNRTYKSLNSTKALTLQAVMMALHDSFYVENYDSGPTNANDCESTSNGRGCLYLTGGVIQVDRGAVGMSDGSGYIKRYSYDRCAALVPPPYFPTTGRFGDNRFLDVNPVGFDARTLFQSLSPAP